MFIVKMFLIFIISVACYAENNIYADRESRSFFVHHFDGEILVIGTALELTIVDAPNLEAIYFKDPYSLHFLKMVNVPKFKDARYLSVLPRVILVLDESIEFEVKTHGFTLFCIGHARDNVHVVGKKITDLCEYL